MKKKVCTSRLISAALAAVLVMSASATPASAFDSGADAWKNQVIMTVEPAKFKSAETDDQWIYGNNSNPSNDFNRFQFALDVNRSSYTGGLIGGDLIGMRNKAAYLKSLGVTTTLIYPIMESDKNDFLGNLPTGYNVSDWTKIDPNFRGAGQASTDYSSYTNLVTDLHSTSIGGYRMNVIQDLSFSFSGMEHQWFKPLTSAGNIDNFRRWDPVTTTNNICGASGYQVFDYKTYIDISAAFNEDVFSYDGAFNNGNLGGTGFTYPAELCGSALTGDIGYSNSISYQLGTKLNSYNNAVKGSSTANTTITVSSAKYATLGVLAAANTANQAVTFRITYSDATTVDVPVTVERFDPTAAPTYYFKSFAHKHSQTADTSGTVYMYNYMLNTDPTKAINSITMVQSAAAANTHVFAVSGFPVTAAVKVDLTSYYNEDGISWDSAKSNGAMQNCGGLIPVEASGSNGYLGTSIVGNYSGTLVNFAVGPRADGKNNIVKGTGQIIDVQDTRYHEFKVAAFGIGTQSNQVFRVTYTDNSYTDTSLTIKDWAAAPAGGDVAVYTGTHIHNAGADDFNYAPKIWGYTLNVDWSKTVKTITLPNNASVKVVAINPLIKLDSSYAMPILDHENSTTLSYTWNNIVKYWMDKGLDGLRIDSVQNFRPNYWKTIINNAGYFKSTYPNAVMFGEVALYGPLPWQYYMERYTNSTAYNGGNGVGAGINFDSIYDTAGTYYLRETFAKDASATGASGVVAGSISSDTLYEKPWNQVAEMDIYENEPFLKYIDNATYPDYTTQKLPKAKLAAAYLFTINRVPMLFSGDENLLNYGAYETGAASMPGYLFSSAVTGNSTYTDNLAYMKALIAMRKNNPSLRSAERMTSTNWIKQGTTLFGFIRQEAGQPSVVAMFNNSPNTVSQFDTTLPSGVTGSNNYNFVKKSRSTYGAADTTVTWPSSNTIRISSMQPWEVKIIKINP